MNIQRFIDNTLKEFILRKLYSLGEVRQKLQTEIFELEKWFLNAEPDTKAWKEKFELLKIKRENLNEILKEETLNLK